MATRYFGIPAANQIQMQGNLVVGASSGGTLAGTQSVQVVFDDTVCDSTPEGKQRLMNAVQIIYDRINAAKSWPIDSTS